MKKKSIFFESEDQRDGFKIGFICATLLYILIFAITKLIGLW